MKKIAWFLSIAGTILFIFAIVLSVARWYTFKANCGDYLKLAGDAPTVARADEFLWKAIQYIEQSGRTSGNSAYIFQTPRSDLAVWYQQILGARETTTRLLMKAGRDPSSVNQLERDNALMKIREVVLDASKEGVEVTTPPHIIWFPYQWLMLILWIISIIAMVIGWILVGVVYQD